MISVLITAPEKLRYRIKSLIYEAQEGFSKAFLVSPGFAVPAFFTTSFVAAGGEEGEREAGRQTERVTSVPDSRLMEGGNQRRGEKKRFSFSPFHFPLADSKKLMTEQEDNLLLCFSAVLSGLGRDGRAAQSCQPLTFSRHSLPFLFDI